MPSAFNPLTTPGKMSTNVGVVSALIDGVRTPLGVTKGGADFNPETKWRAAEFDGRRHIAAGTEEVIEHGPSKITFTVAEFPDHVLEALFPGGTGTLAGGLQPRAAGLALTAGDYLQAPRWELTLKDGSIVRVEFDLGIVANSPTLNTKDKDEATAQVVIEARVDPTKPGYTTDAADYTLTIVPAA